METLSCAETVSKTVTCKFKLPSSGIPSGGSLQTTLFGPGCRFSFVPTMVQTGSRRITYTYTVHLYFDVCDGGNVADTINISGSIEKRSDGGQTTVASFEKVVATSSTRTFIMTWPSAEASQISHITATAVYNVAVSTAPPTTTTSLTSNVHLEKLLRLTLREDSFVDTKFYCFSRRTSEGAVGVPLALFANSHVCSAQSAYLKTLLLNSDFQEGEFRDLHGDIPEGQQYTTSSYDYDSDSDLEDDKDEVGRSDDDGCMASSQTISSPELVDVATPQVEKVDLPSVEDQPEPLGDLNDEDLLASPASWSGEREKKPSFVFGAGEPHPFTPEGGEALAAGGGEASTAKESQDLAAAGDESRPGELRSIPHNMGKGHVGRIICIKDTAYPTWESYLYYLYTGQLAFNALQSEGTRPTEGEKDTLSQIIPPCSPKSMYRLADKLGDNQLQARALKAIRARLSQENIVEELFTRFTSRYSEVQNMQVAFFCDSYRSPKVAESFREKMRHFSKGELELGLVSDADIRG